MAGRVRDHVRSLAEILKKPELEAILKRWDENLKLILISIESKRARAQAIKNERYLLISFYLVFQGGVMNTLAAKANAQKCGFAIFPALLSIAALVGVCLGVHDNFHEYHTMNKKRKTDESESTRLQYKINMLLSKGATFEFEDDEPEAMTTESAGAPSQPVDWWLPGERSYPDVMFFLFGVFFIVLLNSTFVC